jgi:isocitrate dehydrogenase
LCWAKALAKQEKDADLQSRFAELAATLDKNEALIAEEMISCQGRPVDLGGYFMPLQDKITAAMRPSETFNRIIDGM